MLLNIKYLLFGFMHSLFSWYVCTATASDDVIGVATPM